MEQKELYSSGQASEICDVSRRALRLYESKGLIVPDHISNGGYRYFTMETLRRVQVIDIYTSDDQDEYVTEILLPVECDNDEFNYYSDAKGR